MKLNITEKAAINTHFQIERIYIGTIKVSLEKTDSILEEVDILYKVANMFIRFININNKMCAVIVNADQVKNIIPVTKYYQPENLVELEIDGGWIIAVLEDNPLKNYTHDYNK